jgi:hypothetical protein
MTPSRTTPLAIALALCAAVPARAATPKELVGKYQMEVQGGDELELRADGTAAMAGEETRWSAAGDQLTVGPDTMKYRYDGAHLVLAMGSVELSWRRLGPPQKQSPMQKAAAKAQAAPQGQRAGQAAAGPAQQQQAGGGNPQDQQARQLLLSSAWCSFTYNQHTGTSTTQRVVYRPDGTLLVNAGGETYNSGANGTFAGQSATGSTYRWKVENLRLYIDNGQGQGFQDIGLTAERNSSGYPILKALGREYSMCK